MASWNEVLAAAPGLAAAAQGRFDEHGLGLLATLRKDGSPRISGIEPLFALVEVWLGMMDGSRKLADLRRDPRLALHNATVDKDVEHGDARISGRAVDVPPGPEMDAYLEALDAVSEHHPEGPFPLFRVDVTEVSFLRPAGDHLVIEWWREGEGIRRVDRY
jgi:hypothetical protein